MPLDANALDILMLPPIVAGPVLWRLTRTHVSVWIASVRFGDITLAAPVAGQPATEVASTPVTPLQVSNNLWMVTVTIDAPGGFDATTLYEYRLMWPVWPQRNWADVAIDTPQPAFLGPPATIDQLAVLHTSSRKVHCGGRDGSALAADVIAAHVTADTPNPRLHLLVLFGIRSTPTRCPRRSPAQHRVTWLTREDCRDHRVNHRRGPPGPGDPTQASGSSRYK